MKKKLRKALGVINFPYLLFGFLVFASVLSISANFSESKLAKSAHLSFVELSYMAESPFGQAGGISVPASYESGVWNDNGGYHLDGVLTEPVSNNTPPSEPPAPTPEPQTTTPNQAPGAPSVSGSTRVPINQNVGSWQAVATDPQDRKIFYEVDWNGDGTTDGTTEVKNSGDSAVMGHVYTEEGTFTIKVRATQAEDPTYVLTNGPLSSPWTDFVVEVFDPMASNAAPGTPVIGGDTFVRVGQSTGNTIVSTDPEGDEIFYEIDWNGNSTVDGTTSSQPSGAVANIGHIYNTAGTYTVRGRAVQTNATSKRSGWGTYTITVSDDDKCVATANSCGVTSGTIVGGKCEPAALPSGYGTSCASAANVCGMTNTGTVSCSGSCSATVPSNTLCGCNSAPNKCGMTNPGSYDASGSVCLASTPSNTLCGCTSAANKCGMTTTGTYDESGNVCNAVTPSIKSCPMTINDFRASPKLVTSGKTSKLFWDITGDTDLCTIKYYTPANSTLVTILSSLGTDVGQQATTPITERRTYVLNCGSVQAEATIGPFILVEI